ncbi:MAG: hypothetical protein HOL37_01880 [Rhodospirillaceae bacterium]|jgi:flagellar motility protein MotE (MotC chaperone)|nr:hypothetical protein [Rhodospirillaceae bacterium]MBT4218971.1 hypothetical protein [Rhodospirillaceae bacterium]MBT4464266.1 hypothetical protein [Rhodospirillaceae bacterium]MBT5308060.1 hypothetical protein [Rhodospirillaceae bacterium]MBT7356102.1 hypothetical protein [Rhodospirillaceae bacterium]
MKIRFLPVTIFATALLLTVKISDVWSVLESPSETGRMTASPISVSSARAQEKPTTEEIVKEGEDLGLSDEDAADDTEAEDVSRIVTNDPTLLTQAEIDLLQRLADRRESLVDREKEMELRQGLLAAAEARIEKKIAELREFQSTIEKLIKTYDEQQIAKIQSLVKIYENMKPKDAARIFEEMGMDTLLLVTERMSERKLAPIMAKMDPAKATEMTVELSRLRDLPNESMKAGG